MRFNERALDKILQDAVTDLASEYQEMFDNFARYQGRPVSEIKPVLQREFARLGGKISEAQLTDYATHISEGRTITMEIDR